MSPRCSFTDGRFSFDFNKFWRIPKRRHNPTYHPVQKSYFTHVKELWSRTRCCNVFHEYMFAQLFLEFSNVSLCCKCLKIVAVSEYTDDFDKTFVQTRIEQTNVAAPCLHRPFTIRIKSTVLHPSFHTLHGCAWQFLMVMMDHLAFESPLLCELTNEKSALEMSKNGLTTSSCAFLFCSPVIALQIRNRKPSTCGCRGTCH